MIPNVDVVLFAIKAGIRLGGQIRAAYVDNIKRKELILPLPNFPKANEVSALNYFEGAGFHYLKEDKEIKDLTGKAQEQTLSEEDKTRYMTLYQEKRVLDDAQAGNLLGQGVTPEDMIALTMVRQWQSDKDPNPTALKRISGTLIETGIDYFNKFPAVIDDNTVHGKALRSFLLAIDDEDFVNTPVNEIATDMMVAAIETLNETPELLLGDGKSAGFIQKATKDICAEVGAKLTEIRKNGGNLLEEENLKTWSLIVFRSVLKTAAPEVLKSPGVMLTGDNDSMTKVVGSSILKLVMTKVPSKDGIELGLEDLFSRKSLDELASVTFKGIADHYGKKADPDSIEKLMSSAFAVLAETGYSISPDIIPELITKIVGKSLEHESIFNSDPKLLPQILDKVLKVLTEKGDFKFGREQVLSLANRVIDLVANNDNFLAESGAADMIETVQSIVGLAAKLDSKTINSDSLLSLLNIAVSASCENPAWLDVVSGKKKVIETVFEAFINNIQDSSLPAEASWLFANKDFIPQVAEALVEKYSVQGVVAAKVSSLEGDLKGLIQGLSKNKTLSVNNLINEIKKL